MSRLHAVPFGGGLLVVPEWCHPAGDQRITRPTRWKEPRRARV
jgi:hypothetical protein